MIHNPIRLFNVNFAILNRPSRIGAVTAFREHFRAGTNIMESVFRIGKLNVIRFQERKSHLRNSIADNRFPIHYAVIRKIDVCVFIGIQRINHLNVSPQIRTVHRSCRKTHDSRKDFEKAIPISSPQRKTALLFAVNQQRPLFWAEIPYTYLSRVHCYDIGLLKRERNMERERFSSKFKSASVIGLYLNTVLSAKVFEAHSGFST